MSLVVETLISPETRRQLLEEDLRTGLASSPKWLSPIWLYDELGSQLFDEITRLPEYYPTRREQAILTAHCDEIVALAGCSALVELGSGTSEKTRTLLDAMVRASRLHHFVALDVSEEILVESARAVQIDYGVDVTAFVADFQSHLHLLPGAGDRLFAFLGGTIGNFDPKMRQQFYGDLGEVMADSDYLLLGTDLVKDRDRLVAAYDDAAGVTARFNRNVLSVINNEFGANFDLGAFAHVALFDIDNSWIEMRLRSLVDQHARIPGLDLEVAFARGEEIRTEISTKFRATELDAELAGAGFDVVAAFTDPAGDFRLTLVRRGT